MSNNTDHWETVYQTKNFDAVSWYTPHLGESLKQIHALCPHKDQAIIDIGGGESTLVDDLLAQHYTNLSVLDISSTAIKFTQQRLGHQSVNVRWHVGDITHYDFADQQFDLWHDRAVFHFLTEAHSRMLYINRVKQSVKPGGFVVMATFGAEGPLQCSGLDIERYTVQKLHNTLGNAFKLINHQHHQHTTPWGTTQAFLYSCWMLLDQ